MIAGVVLAAGASSRLGRPKQTLVLDRETLRETLVERATRIALHAGLSPVIVVVPPAAAFASTLQTLGALPVENLSAATGIASSIRCGVQHASGLGATGVVLLSCDQIALTSDHLRQLCKVPQRMTGSRYAGRIGIPAYFPAAHFAALLQLTGDTGARDLLHNAAAIADEALALDIDTQHDAQHAGLI